MRPVVIWGSVFFSYTANGIERGQTGRTGPLQRLPCPPSPGPGGSPGVAELAVPGEYTPSIRKGPREAGIAF